MANVWVKALDGQVIRSERIAALTAARVPRQGWTVIAELGRGHPVHLAGARAGRQGEGWRLPAVQRAAAGDHGRGQRGHRHVRQCRLPEGRGTVVDPGRPARRGA